MFVKRLLLLISLFPFLLGHVHAKGKNCDPPVPPFPIAYGELYTAGTVIQAGVAGVPVLLTTFNTVGLSSGTTPNAALDLITINVSGIFEISLNVAFEGASGRDWTFQVARNGVAQANLLTNVGSLGTSNDTVNGVTSGLLSITAGDIITVLVSVTGAATTLSMEAANLHVVRIE